MPATEEVKSVWTSFRPTRYVHIGTKGGGDAQQYLDVEMETP
jgi:hypothetical protein